MSRSGFLLGSRLKKHYVAPTSREDSMFNHENFVLRYSARIAILGCLGIVACSGAPDDNESADTLSSETSALSAKCAPSVPSPTLAVPDGNKLAFSYDAVGVQIYACQATTTTTYGWVFKGPEATLYNNGGNVAGTHYASPTGPTWEANDGTSVVGAKVSAFTVDPTSIPWLLLTAISHSGEDGRMSKVSYIQRLDTTGGLAPTTGCDATSVGETARVDYTATYYFYVPGDQLCQ